MICNRAQLADIVGVTPKAITDWQKEGLPFANKRGRDNAYETADVIRWMIDREKLKQAKQQVASGGIDIDHEKARKERALADKHELDYQFRRGELLEAKDVERQWLNAIHTARSRLMGVPSKVAPIVVTLDNPKAAEQLIAQEQREALEGLGDDDVDTVDEDAVKDNPVKKRVAKKAARKRKARK